MNTLMLTPISRRWSVLRDALESTAYVALAFVFFLVSGFIPLIVVPVAYVLAGIAVIASLKWTKAGISGDWLGAIAGCILVLILVVFNDRYASVGAAAAAACVALTIRISTAARSNRRRAHSTIRQPESPWSPAS
jgi:MFS superfamily sulfate permease-like transporter